MSEPALCRTCDALSECPLLMRKVNREDVFDYKKVITEENPSECTRWTPADEATVWERKAQYEMFGLQSLQALHMLPPTRKETDVSSVPDFQSMLQKGVTYKEREAQLRYETDEEGNLLTDPTGAKTPRGSRALRKYITDPDGPVRLQNRVVLDWSPKKLIDEILKAEKEQGLLLSPQEKRKQLADEDGESSGEENDMAKVTTATRRVNVRSKDGGSTPSKAKTGGGVRASGATAGRRPATARTVKPAQAAEPEVEPEAIEEEMVEEQVVEEQVVAAAEIDYDLLADKVVEALGPVVEEKVEKAKAEIIEELGAGVEATVGATLGHLNILHDLLCSYFEIDNTVLDKPDLQNGIADLVDAPDEGEPEGNA